MPDKKYLIEIPGMPEGSGVWDSDKWERNKDAFMSDYPEANVFELGEYDAEDTNENDQIMLTFENDPDSSGVWDSAKWERNKEAFTADHPEAKVNRVRYVDYWGNAAQENRVKREELSQPDAERDARLADLGYYDDMSGQQKDFSLENNTIGLKPVSSAIEQNSVSGETTYHDPKLAEFYANDSAHTERMAEIARLDAEYDSNPSVVAQREWEQKKRAEQEKYIDDSLASIREDINAEVNALEAGKGAFYKTASGQGMGDAAIIQQAMEFMKGKDAGQAYVEKEKLETYASAAKLFEKAKQAYDVAGKGFWGATADVGMDKLRDLATQSDIEAYNQIGDILTRLETRLGSLNEVTDKDIESNLSKEEQALIKGFFAYNEAMSNAQQDMSQAYKGGKIFGESISFMLEFLATGGLAGGTGKAAGNAVGKGLVKWAAKAAKGTAQRAARTVATKAARALTSAAVGTLARTVAAPGTYQRMAEDSVKIEDGHLNRGKNAFKAFTDSYIENLSEISGGVIGKSLKMAGVNPSKILGGMSFGKVGKMLADNSVMQAIAKGGKALFGENGVLKKFGFNGIFEEVEEEYIGNLIRELTIQPGALEEMHKDGNFGAMIIGFAPMTLFGAGMSAVSIGAKNIEAANLGKKLRENLSLHYTDQQIDHMMNIVSGAENADQVWEAIKPLTVGLSAEETQQLLQYGAFMAQNKAMLFAKKAQDDNLAQAKRAEAEHTYGKFWQENAEGAESVQLATLNDGRSVFVLSEPTADGVVSIIDAKTGEKGFTNVSNYKTQEVNGEVSPMTQKWSMDAYLEGSIAADRMTAEQARMTREYDEQVKNLQSQIQEGTQINLGTEGSPVILLATGKFVKDGVVAVDQTGNTHTVGWNQVADAMGQPIIVKTDQQVVDEEIAGIIARNAERRKKMSNATPAMTEAVNESAAQTSETVAQETKHIPLNEDGTVNEAAFWEQDPEGYAQWNDEQNHDSGADTIQQIEAAKAELTAMLNEAQQATLTSNPANRKAAKREVGRLAERLARLEALEQSYADRALAPLRERAKMWADLTGAPVHVIETEEELAAISAKVASENAKQGSRVRGFAKDGKAYIFLPGIQDVREIDEVFFHEAVAHNGLKGLLGKENYDKLCEQVWNMMSPAARNQFIRYPGVNGDYRAAADEYIAHIAEKMGANIAEAEEKTIWQKIVDFVRNVLRAMGIELNVTEQELSDLLHQAYADLANNMAKAEQTASREAMSAVEEAPSEARQQYDALLEDLTPEEIEAVAQNDFNAAQEAYNAHLANAPKVEPGESSKAYIERKKAYNDELKRLESELNAQQALMDEITAIKAANAPVLTDVEILEKDGFGVDEQHDDVRMSVRYTPTDEQKEAIINSIVNVTGRSREEAERWLASETSLAAMINDDLQYLDYVADPKYKAIKDNSDYPQGTVDFNNICRKRVPFTRMFTRLQRAFPNRVFTADELADIRTIMSKDGLTVACGLCYVEDRRQMVGEVAQSFIDGIQEGFETYANNPTKRKNAEKFKALIGEDAYVPQVYDLTTQEGLDKLYNEHRGIWEAFQAFNNARGQQSQNLLQGYAEYKREILSWSDKKVKQVNDNGGLRIFSYSDFEAHHLIDVVQIIIDCASKGVKIQGYTKVPAFARAVANTGIKLNRSLIPLGDTGLVDGQLAFDPVEGIDINDPDFLESNDNVGNILIGINDEQIRVSMNDPRIHYIIPYHARQKENIRQKLNVGAWTNYISTQNERNVSDGKRVKDNINIYTDILTEDITTDRQFVEKYLQLCAEQGRIPKFDQFLDKDAEGNYVYTPGYYKFLIDFKLFDENGNILPQQPVVAEFDDAFNMQILENYAKDERESTGEQMNETYDKIVDALGLYKSTAEGQDVRFSVRTVNQTAQEFHNDALTDFRRQFNLIQPTTVVDVNDRAALAKALGLTPEELSDEKYQLILDGVNDGGRSFYDDDTKRIAIFALEKQRTSAEVDENIFHENTHAIVSKNPEVLELGQWLWDNAKSGIKMKTRNSILDSNYPEWQYANEMLSRYTGIILSMGRAGEVLNMLPADQKKHWEFILKEFGYEPEREDGERIRRYDADSRRAGFFRKMSQQKMSDNGAAEKGTRFSSVGITPEVRDEMDRIAATAIIDGNYMLAPNGQPTKLTADQWALVRTENFKRWFGDWENDPDNASKVVDENGEPRVMYHGSAWQPLNEPAGQAVFKMNGGILGEGAYFASSLTEATMYAEMATELDTSESGNYEVLQDEFVTDYFLNIRNAEDIMDQGDGEIIAVAKSPSQIKSSTDNAGEFSAEEGDIRLSFKPVGGNSGYVGYSMSRRAAMARSEGRYPKTDFRKEYGVTSASLDALVYFDIIDNSEWHHTSVYGNKTTFYGWSEEEYADIYADNKKVIDGIAREFKKADEAYRNSGKELHERLVAGEITPQEVYELGREADRNHLRSIDEMRAKIDSIFNPSEEGDIRYSLVTDPALLERLESEPTIKVYRAMQLIDGKLYPPMSAKVDGKMREPIELGKWEQAEERPDLADEKGYFKLDKGNKTSLKARYNPYFHTSPTPLNDQFSSAQTRPELVTVEVEVPESELTSGYKADKAKDSVGKMEWKAGVIQGKLSGTRTVILSRWDKPVRIVPDSEVADVIVKMFEGKDITMPSNVVTPSLRAELEKRGVPFAETDNQGKPVEANISYSVLSAPADEIVAEGMKFSIQDFARLAGNIFQDMPESFRKEAIEETFKKGWDMQSAIFQIPARLAEKTEWTDEDKDLARIIREKVQDAVDESGAVSDRPLTTKEALWMLYRSTSGNGDDLISAARRSLVAHNLGFDPGSERIREMADEHIRYSVVRNNMIDSATDMYNYEASLWTNRLKESWLDMNQSVISLQNALAEASGKPIEPWENLELALNQLSSRSYADKKKYMRDFLEPLWDVVLEIIEKTDYRIEDIERYMMLKHALERNLAFAKRDAREFYKNMYDRVADRMKNQSHAQRVVALSEAKKVLAGIDARLATATNAQKQWLTEARSKAQLEVDIAELALRGDEQKNEAELNAIYDSIDNGTNPKFLEFREKDYGGLTSMFVDFDRSAVKSRSSYKSEEAYQQAVIAATKPRFDNVADMENAARDEVDVIEQSMPVLSMTLWHVTRKATGEILRHQHASGMITTEQYDAVRNMFQHYVPLRGFADNTAEDMYSYYMNNSSNGFAMPIIGAKGRKTKAESPLGWIGTMAESAIQSDNKNDAKMRLYYALLNRPDTGVLSIAETWYEYTGQKDANDRKIFAPVYPPATGKAMTADELRQHMDTWEADMMQKRAAGNAFKGNQSVNLRGSVVFQDTKEDKEHIIRVKVAGKDYSILVNGNPRAAQAINGLLNPDANVGPVGEWVGNLRRNMSALMTSFSPLFWVSNYQRDLLSSFMRTSESEGWKQAFKYLNNRRKAWRVASYIYKNDKGRLGNSYYENLYKEFAENGGITGYTSLTTNKEYEKLLEEYAQFADKPTRKWIKNAWNNFMGFGEAIEQVSRFAAFITAREAGKSVEEAVNAAKEVSVNFNRKGSAKPLSLDEIDKLRTKDGKPLNKAQKAVAVVLTAMPKGMKELYFFFNASIQALSSSAKLAKQSPGKATAWAGMYMGLSMALAAINYLISGDDDEEEYLDLPDYARRSNALVKISDEYYLKWSLPQEMRPFYATADIILGKAVGNMPHKSVGKEIALAVAEWLPVNPFGTDDPLLSLVPDFAAPLAEIKANKNFVGGKIYDDMAFKSEGEKENIPAYRKATSKTGKIYVEVAEVLNAISGGDEVQKGAININPAVVEHLVEGYGGGLYDFAKMMVSFPAMLISDEDVEVRNIPFVNKVVMSVDETNMYTHTNEVFYHYRDIAENAERVEKEYRNSDDPSRADAYRQEEDWRIHQLFEQYDAELKEIKDKLKNAADKEEEDLLKQSQNAVRELLLNDIATGKEPDPVLALNDAIKEISKEISAIKKPFNDAEKKRKKAKESGDMEGAQKAKKERDEIRKSDAYKTADKAGKDLKELRDLLDEIKSTSLPEDRDSLIAKFNDDYQALKKKLESK